MAQDTSRHGVVVDAGPAPSRLHWCARLFNCGLTAELDMCTAECCAARVPPAGPAAMALRRKTTGVGRYKATYIAPAQLGAAILDTSPADDLIVIAA